MSAILDDARAHVRTVPLRQSPAAPLFSALLVMQRVVEAHGIDELRDRVREVGRRLEDALDHGALDARALWAKWGEHELLPLLDATARALTTCAKQARPPADVDVAAGTNPRVADLAGALFEDLSGACVALGWLEIERVIPDETAFDARLHKAVDRVSDGKRSGLIVELLRPGRRGMRNGPVTSEPAHVVVAAPGTVALAHGESHE